MKNLKYWTAGCAAVSDLHQIPMTGLRPHFLTSN